MLAILGGFALITILGTPRQVRANEGQEDLPPAAFVVSGDAGFGHLELNPYIELHLSMLIRLGPLRMDLWAPFRFQINDRFSFRREDYNEARDLLKIPQCVRLDLGDYTPPPDTFDTHCDVFDYPTTHGRYYASFRVAPLHHFSLGTSSSVVHAFRGNMDLDRPQLGAAADIVLSDWGQLEVGMDDILRPRFMAGNVMIRPPNVAGRDWDRTPESVEVGFTWAADIHAPLHLVTAFDRPVVNESNDLQFIRDQVHIVGGNFEWLQTFNLFDEGALVEKPVYGFLLLGDYNRFLDVGASDALHLGARFVLMKAGWDFRLGAEYRRMGNRYIPEYFDTDYAIRSQRFALTPQALALPGVTERTTLLEYRRGLPGGHIHGIQAWMSLTIPISDTSSLPITAFLEDASGNANASASLIIGPVRLGHLIVSAQYLRRNFDSLRQIFALDGTLLRLLGAWHIGSYFDPNTFMNRLVLNFRYDRRFFQDQQGIFQQTNDISVTLGVLHGG